MFARASGTFTALALWARVVKVPRPEKSFQRPSCKNNYCFAAEKLEGVFFKFFVYRQGNQGNTLWENEGDMKGK